MPYMDSGVRRGGPVLGRGVRVAHDLDATPSVLPFLTRGATGALGAKVMPSPQHCRQQSPAHDHQLAISPRSPPLTKTQKRRQEIALLRQRNGCNTKVICSNAQGGLIPRPPPPGMSTRRVQDIGSFEKRGVNIISGLRFEVHDALAVEKPLASVASSPMCQQTEEAMLPFLSSPPTHCRGDSGRVVTRLWSENARQAQHNIDTVGTRQQCAHQRLHAARAAITVSAGHAPTAHPRPPSLEIAIGVGTRGMGGTLADREPRRQWLAAHPPVSRDDEDTKRARINPRERHQATAERKQARREKREKQTEVLSAQFAADTKRIREEIRGVAQEVAAERQAWVQEMKEAREAREQRIRNMRQVDGAGIAEVGIPAIPPPQPPTRSSTFFRSTDGVDTNLLRQMDTSTTVKLQSTTTSSNHQCDAKSLRKLDSKSMPSADVHMQARIQAAVDAGLPPPSVSVTTFHKGNPNSQNAAVVSQQEHLEARVRTTSPGRGGCPHQISIEQREKMSNERAERRRELKKQNRRWADERDALCAAFREQKEKSQQRAEDAANRRRAAREAEVKAEKEQRASTRLWRKELDEERKVAVHEKIEQRREELLLTPRSTASTLLGPSLSRGYESRAAEVAEEKARRRDAREAALRIAAEEEAIRVQGWSSIVREWDQHRREQGIVSGGGGIGRGRVVVSPPRDREAKH